MAKYNVIERVRDNIPGFRETETDVIATFDTRKDAEDFLSTCKNSSVDHSGYGAGSGTIDTTYYIQEKKE